MTLGLCCANPDIPDSFIHSLNIYLPLKHDCFTSSSWITQGRTDGKHILGLQAEVNKSSLTVKQLIKTQMDDWLSHHFLGPSSTD